MKIFVLIIGFVLKVVFCDDVNSLTEGDSVTLHCEFINIQKYEHILWTFGPDRIAQIKRSNNKVSLYSLDGKFNDRLHLDQQTGSLTITNVTCEHAGLYELMIIDGNEVLSKKFIVTVSAVLPVPVIIRNSSQCSSSCSVVCSVVNVSHVTLSWIKGSSLLSSISVSDLSISLSLPLEVEDQDTHNYSCVVNNTVKHQSTHLDVSGVCQTCTVDTSNTEKSLPFSHVVLICAGIALVLTVLAGVGMIGIYLKYRRTNQAAQYEHTEMNNGDALTESDALKMLSVSVGESVTLNTGVTKIKSYDVLQWRFGELNTDRTNPFVVLARMNEPKLYNCDGHDNTFKDRIQLDRQTGFLTIKDIRHTDFGIYKLNISRNKRTVISKTFLIQDSSENTVVSEANTLLNTEEITIL